MKLWVKKSGTAFSPKTAANAPHSKTEAVEYLFISRHERATEKTYVESRHGRGNTLSVVKEIFTILSL